MKYKAFISYSHSADAKLAPRLQSALQSFARPWYRGRTLHLFRDTTNLSAAPELWRAIEQALSESEFLIHLASPEAANSKWVRQELTYWQQNKSMQKLLIVVTGGRVAWDANTSDFDWQASSALCDALRGHFPAEPLYLDFSALRGAEISRDNDTFLDGVASLAASLHGKSKDEIIGEHLRQQRRVVRLVCATIVVLLTLLVVAVCQYRAAERRRLDAERETRVATAERLAAQARNHFSTDPPLSILLASEALRTSLQPDTPWVATAEQALSEALENIGGKVVVHYRDQASASFNLDGEFFTTSCESEAQLWRLEGETPVALVKVPTAANNVGSQFSSDGKHWIVGLPDGACIYDLNAQPLLAPVKIPVPGGIQNANYHSATGVFFAANWRGYGELWDTRPSAHFLRRIEETNRTVDTMRGTFSPDGRYLFTDDLGADRSLQWFLLRWDLQHEEKPQLTLIDGDASDTFVVSPDGRWLAAEGEHHRMVLFDFANETTVAFKTELQGYEARPNRILFSSDSQWLCAGTASGEVLLYRLGGESAPRQPTHKLMHSAGVSSLAFSPDGRQLAAGGEDGRCLLVDLSENAALASAFLPRIHRDYLWECTFSRDGRRLITEAMHENIAALWSIAGAVTAADPLILRGHGPGSVATALDSSGRRMLTAGEDGTVRLWDLQRTAQSVSPITWRDESGKTELCVVSPNGEWALTVGAKTAALHSLKSPEQGMTVLPHRSLVTSAAFSPNGNVLVTRSRDGTTWHWRLREPAFEQHPEELPLPDHAIFTEKIAPVFHGLNPEVVSAGEVSIQYAPNEEGLVAIGSHDGSVKLLTEGTSVSQTLDFGGMVRYSTVDRLIWSPKGRWLAAARPDAFGLWSMPASGGRDRKPKLLTESSSPEGSGGNEFDPQPMQFSHDEGWFASAHGREVKLWDLSTAALNGEAIPLATDEREVRSVRFSPNGQWLLAYGAEAYLWQLRSGTSPANRTKLPMKDVSTAEFSPDGYSLIVGTHQGTLFVMNLRQVEKPPITLLGHPASVRAVRFQPDGQRFVSAGDAEVHVWAMANLEGGFASIPGLSGHVENVALAQNGALLLVQEEDAVRIVPMGDEDLLRVAEGAAGRDFSADEKRQYHVRP